MSADDWGFSFNHWERSRNLPQSLSVGGPELRALLMKAFKGGWAYATAADGPGCGDMRAELESTLSGLPEAIKACKDESADMVALTSVAFGGGGQTGGALREEMRLLGSFVKLAGCYGKKVTVLPFEEEK